MGGYNQRQLNNGQQGDGSGLDADTLDAKESTEIGKTPDGVTIIEEGGVLKTKPNTVIVGDFENGNSGSWTSEFGSFDSTYGGAEGSSNSGRLNIIDGNNEIVKRTFDLSSYSTLTFYARVDLNNYNEVGDYFECIVGGNVEVQVEANSTDDSWKEYEVDISNYTGSEEIELRINANDQDGDNDNMACAVDRIKLKADSAGSITVDGAGGT